MELAQLRIFGRTPLIVGVTPTNDAFLRQACRQECLVAVTVEYNGECVRATYSGEEDTLFLIPSLAPIVIIESVLGRRRRQA